MSYSHPLRARRLGVVILAAALALLAAQSVAAHSEYQKSTPADGAKLDTPPARIVATFSAAMKPASSKLRLKDPTGAIIATGGVRSGDSAPRTMTIENLPILAPGTYTVLWNTVATDNDAANGSFVFTVLAAASPSPAATPEPTAEPTPEPTEAPTQAPTAPPAQSPSAPASVPPTSSASVPASTAAPTSSPGATTVAAGGASSSGGGDSTGILLVAIVVVGAAIGAGFLIARRRSTT